MRIIITLIGLLNIVYSYSQDHLTSMLHAEVSTLKSSVLQEAASPILYGILSRLTQAAHISIPKRIAIFDSEYETTRKDEFKNTIIQKHTAYIQTYFDLFGDLVIYREILLNASYNELEGILALAVAEHANSKLLSQIFAAVGTFGAITAATLTMAKMPNLLVEPDNLVAGGIHIGLLSSLLSFVNTGKYIQKNSVITALSLTDPEYVRDGLYALSRIREKNSTPSMIVKAFEALHLKKLHTFLTKSFSSHNLQEILIQEVDKYLE